MNTVWLYCLLIWKLGIQEWKTHLSMLRDTILIKDHQPKSYGLNSDKIITNKEGVTRFVILVPGMTGHLSPYGALVRAFEIANINNVHTTTHDQTDDNPLPTEPLEEKIEELAARAPGKVEFVIVGHSLGGIIGAKLQQHDERIVKVIAVASRLVVDDSCIFSGFWAGIREDILQLNLQSEKFVTICGSEDLLVPKTSVLVPGSEEHTIDGYNHLGIVRAPATIDIVMKAVA